MSNVRTGDAAVLPGAIPLRVRGEETIKGDIRRMLVP
jgi:hypothetical protein